MPDIEAKWADHGAHLSEDIVNYVKDWTIKRGFPADLDNREICVAYFAICGGLITALGEFSSFIETGDDDFEQALLTLLRSIREERRQERRAEKLGMN